MPQPFPGVLERTFTRAVSLAQRQSVALHRNGVAVLGLAAGHPALEAAAAPGAPALAVSFNADVAVQRKRKRGRAPGAVSAAQVLATVTVGEAAFPVWACMSGHVLELHTALEGDAAPLLHGVRAVL